MMDLCFYILLNISIVDNYRDFNRKTSIQSEKSAMVYGDLRESRVFLPSFPILRDS